MSYQEQYQNYLRQEKKAKLDAIAIQQEKEKLYAVEQKRQITETRAIIKQLSVKEQIEKLRNELWGTGEISYQEGINGYASFNLQSNWICYIPPGSYEQGGDYGDINHPTTVYTSATIERRLAMVDVSLSHRSVNSVVLETSGICENIPVESSYLSTYCRNKLLPLEIEIGKSDYSKETDKLKKLLLEASIATKFSFPISEIIAHERAKINLMTLLGRLPIKDALRANFDIPLSWPKDEHL